MFVLLLYSHLYSRVQRSQAFIPPESDCYVILNLQFRTYKIISQYKFATSDLYSVDHLVSLPSNFQILLAAKYKFTPWSFGQQSGKRVMQTQPLPGYFLPS